MKNGSPIGKFMGTDEERVNYLMTVGGFERITSMGVSAEELESMAELFDETDESDKEFIKYFEESYYNVSLTFPKRVKSVSIDGATISEDGKTVTYKASWIEYLKNPIMLDVKVDFVDE
jgi:hypothetical protein